MGQRWRGKAPKGKAPSAAAQPKPATRPKRKERPPASGMIRDRRQLDMCDCWVDKPPPYEAVAGGGLVTLARTIMRERSEKRKISSSTAAVGDTAF